MDIKKYLDLNLGEDTGYIVDRRFYTPNELKLDKPDVYKYLTSMLIQGAEIPYEKTLEEYKIELIEKVYKIIDEKQSVLLNTYFKDVKGNIEKQLKRYEVKYRKAVKAKETNDYSLFVFSASMEGKSPEEIVDEIIENYTTVSNYLEDVVVYLDDFRRFIKNKIYTIEDIDGVKFSAKFLNSASKLPLTISVADIYKIFKFWENRDLAGLENFVENILNHPDNEKKDNDGFITNKNVVKESTKNTIETKDIASAE